jgi:hypothetical protein
MNNDREREEIAAPGLLPQAETVDPPPWELIDKGRYMPRRIRGSFLGRELG